MIFIVFRFVHFFGLIGVPSFFHFIGSQSSGCGGGGQYSLGLVSHAILADLFEVCDLDFLVGCVICCGS